MATAHDVRNTVASCCGAVTRRREDAPVFDEVAAAAVPSGRPVPTLRSLAGGVFTSDVATLRKLFASLEVGGVVVNDSPSTRVDPMPYGGVKLSGLGREGARYAMEAFSERRTLVW